MTVLANRAQLALQRVADVLVQELTSLVEPTQTDPKACAWLTFVASATLKAFQSPTREAPPTFSDYLYAREKTATTTRPQILVNSCQLALEKLAPVLQEMNAALSKGLPTTVNTDFGVSRLIDYLRANIIEVSCLTTDLGLEIPRASMAESVRSLLSVMAERFEGQSIEVRVPPFSAVQVGAFGQGPTHTRGTPPNLVETNPKLFLDLATGRLRWNEALTTGQLQVSGAHASQTTAMLPVFRVESLISAS